jgi:hypothetical protein
LAVGPVWVEVAGVGRLAEFGGILVIWWDFGGLGQKTIFAVSICQGSLLRSAVR